MFLIQMKSKQKLETCTLEFPVTVDFLDLGIVEQVVAEAFFKEPKRRKKKPNSLYFPVTYY